MFKTIVLAVDGSASSNKALQAGCDIARHYKAELHLVHSPQLETAAIAPGFGTEAASKDPNAITKAGKSIMDAAVSACAAENVTPASTQVSPDEPSEAILLCAEMQDADLIVMGRRGLNAIASFFLGSVSQVVTKGAKCSVMTVHT